MDRYLKEIDSHKLEIDLNKDYIVTTSRQKRVEVPLKEGTFTMYCRNC
jgi:hypothetical protein